MVKNGTVPRIVLEKLEDKIASQSLYNSSFDELMNQMQMAI